jgi:putative hydrolase of the HAD superfamily
MVENFECEKPRTNIKSTHSQYNYVIFDLDDTLCDYEKAKRNAINYVNKILKRHKIDIHQFWENYELMEPVLWRKFCDKTITKREYRIRRYADALQGLYEPAQNLADELNCIYMREANHNVELFSDVIPLFNVMKKKEIEPVILTNGPSDGQRDKVKALALDQHIQYLYISEEIGLSKPDPSVFEYVLQELKAAPSEVVMVGDSVEGDIKGAEEAGIEAVLIDRKNRYKGYTGVKIDNLLDLVQLL